MEATTPSMALFAHRTGKARSAIFDPPTLWLGDDILKARKALGSRSPVELSNGDGTTTLSATGALFGVSGDADYTFDQDGRLIWMAVQAQCSEEKYDFTMRRRPEGLDPDYEEWRRSEDAWAFDMGEQETSCDKVFAAHDIIEKLFGKPSRDRSNDHDQMVRGPGDSFLCHELYGGGAAHPECKDQGALRSTWDYEYIGTDRMTGIGIELRQYYYHGVIQFGADYFPEAKRREIFAVLSIWGEAGRPVIEGHPYGPNRTALAR